MWFKTYCTFLSKVDPVHPEPAQERPSRTTTPAHNAMQQKSPPSSKAPRLCMEMDATTFEKKQTAPKHRRFSEESRSGPTQNLHGSDATLTNHHACAEHEMYFFPGAPQVPHLRTKSEATAFAKEDIGQIILKTYVFYCRKSSCMGWRLGWIDATCTNHRTCAQLWRAAGNKRTKIYYI